jgi:uncharacterized RDD family membrane protein YckC
MAGKRVSDIGDSSAVPDWFSEPALWQRFVGTLLDGVLFLGAVLVYAILRGDLETAFVPPLVAAVYTITLIAANGQTVGKRAVGTRVVDLRTGATPSWEQAAMRWFIFSGVQIVAIRWLGVPGGFGGLYEIVIVVLLLPPPLHRSLHDRAARTVVTAVS